MASEKVYLPLALIYWVFKYQFCLKTFYIWKKFKFINRFKVDITPHTESMHVMDNHVDIKIS